MQWGCSHPYDPWNYTSIFSDWIPALWVSWASGYLSLTPQLSSRWKHPRYSLVLTTADKSSWKSQRKNGQVSTVTNKGCGSLPPPLSHRPWVCRCQLLIQAAFFPKNLSRGEDFLQNMTLTGSNPKEMLSAPCLSSGVGFWAGWPATATEVIWDRIQHGNIPLWMGLYKKLALGQAMGWEWCENGPWQVLFDSIDIVFRCYLTVTWGDPAAGVPGCHKCYPSCFI